MSNAPGFYALAQARFNPVAAMDKYVDQIQDRLRQQGYPLYAPQHITHLVIPGSGPANQVTGPQIQPIVLWLMTRSNRTAGFILAPSAITYHTTHYQTHDEFISELLRGLTAVHEIVRLDHVARLGLRYLDAILPRPGESVEQYLAGGLHGIEFNADRRYTMAESVFTTKEHPLAPSGNLIVRVTRMTARLGFPPDISSGGLVMHPRFAEEKIPRDHAIIDTDHYAEGIMPVDRDKLNEQLRSLHTAIQAVFAATTSDHARAAWA
jgi:uncharacterized protein (TIGR04255 family)